MTIEVLPCCCAVSPCPCFQTTGGYRVTWTGIVSHSPVGCACLLLLNVPPGYSGPSFEVYTLRNAFTSGVPAKDLLWVQPTQANPAPCFFSSGLVVFGSGIAADAFDVGFGGYCVGPSPLPLSTLSLSFSATITLFPYRPSIAQKWRVVVDVRPFRLTFQSDSTDCDPTGFYLTNSEVVGLTSPETSTCHGVATAAQVASTLIAEGTVSVVRI